MSANEGASEGLFGRIQRGMTMKQVESILGAPDDTQPVRVGEELLATWIYHTATGAAYIWFDENNKVKLTSGP